MHVFPGESPLLLFCGQMKEKKQGAGTLFPPEVSCRHPRMQEWAEETSPLHLSVPCFSKPTSPRSPKRVLRLPSPHSSTRRSPAPAAPEPCCVPPQGKAGPGRTGLPARLAAPGGEGGPGLESPRLSGLSVPSREPTESRADLFLVFLLLSSSFPFPGSSEPYKSLGTLAMAHHCVQILMHCH